jgi:hydroxymethylpyrimidine/phosphomethylpyrimidine kinase
MSLRPSVLVVAGLDPSGGGGLAADLEALAAVGARGLPVASALTAQGPRGARSVWPVAPERLLAQMEPLLAPGAPAIAAVKVGMLGTAANATALARFLDRAPLRWVPVVLDPVLAASSGRPLYTGDTAALTPLLRRAALLTPNRPELAALTGRPVRSDHQAVAAARALGAAAVLVKGGHRRGAPLDLLVTADEVTAFPGVRRPGAARGTGCRLASAVAGLLGRGASLVEAIAGAKRLVERYLDGYPLAAVGAMLSRATRTRFSPAPTRSEGKMAIPTRRRTRWA